MNATDNFERLLVRELDGFKRELALYPDNESLWKTVPGVSNAGGNLALHVAGNLHQFIGGFLGRTGYIRNRDDEFGRRSGTREEIISEMDRVAAVVREILPHLSSAELEAEIEPMPGMRIRTDLFLAHLCVHAGYHLGQLGYLRRIVTGSVVSSGALPVRPIAL
jgi:hypothetical protein